MPLTNTRNILFELIDAEDETGVTRNIPPLILEVNPDKFSISSKNIITTEPTRGAWVEEHWGRELDNISAAGSTGSFVLPKGILTVEDRFATVGYKNFKELNDLYKNNGSAFDDNGNIVAQGTVRITFDMGSFEGFFESFDYPEDSKIPFRFNYSWSFKVEKTILRLG